MASQGWVCSMCRQKTATTFCQCGKEETFLCEDCIRRHFEKLPGYHSSLPVAAFGDHKAPGYADRLQERKRNFELAKDELLRSLPLFDECIKQLKAAVEGQIHTLTIWLAGKTADLRIQKVRVEDEITEAIAEVEASMYQDKPVLENPFSLALRNYTPNCGLREAFRYSLNPEALCGRLDDVLKVELAASRTAFLPNLDFSSLCLFNCLEKRWEKPVEILPRLLTSADTQCVLIDQRRLFVCGGMGGSKKSYIISREGTWEDAGDMRDSRSSPGVLHYAKLAQNCVYAFGGYPTVRSAERYSLNARKWTADVPDMGEAHSYFTPVTHLNDVYLVGGCSRAMEVYSPEKQTIRKLAIVLPETEACVAAVSGNAVSVFSVNYFAVYTIQNSGELSETTAPIWLEKPLEPYLKSCVVLDSFCFLCRDGLVAWFDLRTGQKHGRSSL